MYVCATCLYTLSHTQTHKHTMYRFWLVRRKPGTDLMACQSWALITESLQMYNRA